MKRSSLPCRSECASEGEPAFQRPVTETRASLRRVGEGYVLRVETPGLGPTLLPVSDPEEEGVDAIECKERQPRAKNPRLDCHGFPTIGA